MTALILPAPTQAYVNHGRWLADCPAGCNNAMPVDRGQTAFLCGFLIDGALKAGCGATGDLQWPEQPGDIEAALFGRMEQHRNWAPAGHRQTTTSYTRDGRTIADAFPGGQTAADLREEGAC